MKKPLSFHEGTMFQKSDSFEDMTELLIRSNKKRELTEMVLEKQQTIIIKIKNK